jgi:endonuclease/exonuclease/phosphatase family metal-dependent hydrolase
VSGADSLLPPVAYSWWVPALGAALLLAVAGWYAYVLLSTRHDRPGESLAMAADGRARYVAAVEAALARYEAEELDVRSLHLELARTMRAFASERIGRDVTSWTRGDIAAYDPTRSLGELLARWEEPSFARRSDAEADEAAAAAREVVALW